jgi:hypothetical protein
MHVRVLALAVLLCAPALAFAQEQTILINGSKGVLPTPQTYVDVNNATLKSFSAAKTLVVNTLGSTALDNNGTVIIHVLRWKDAETVDKHNWYVYHDGVNSQEEFTGLRIFGKHKISLLFVHLNVKGAAESEVNRYRQKTPPAEGTVTTRQRFNSWDECKLFLPNNETPTFFLDKYCVPLNYLNVTYKVVATPKLPAAIADLAKLIQPQNGQRGDDIEVETIALWGGEEMNNLPVPSDIKVTPIQEDKQLDSRTFDNEGRYFWDISAALPIRSLKETTYDQTAQSFAPKTVDRQSLYAVFNIYPVKMDTKSTGNWRLTPALLIGAGIQKRPFDRVLFAGALGIGRIQFFVGTAMTKKQIPKPDGTLGEPAYRTNLTYGLNVPLRQVLDKLKAPK